MTQPRGRLISATWTFAISQSGQYDVAANWTTDPNRAPDAPFTIRNNGNVLGTVTVNQQVNGGQFNSLGTFTLGVGTLEVVLTNAASSFVIADAVQLTLVSPDNVVDNTDTTAPDFFSAVGTWPLSSSETNF